MLHLLNWRHLIIVNAQGVRVLTRSLHPGDVFGEVALLTSARRQADCVAVTRVKVRTNAALAVSITLSYNSYCHFQQLASRVRPAAPPAPPACTAVPLFFFFSFFSCSSCP